MAAKSTVQQLFAVDDVTLGELAQPGGDASRSTSLERFSTVSFWIVVAGLIGARVVYFDPLYSHAASFVAGLSRTLLSGFG